MAKTAKIKGLDKPGGKPKAFSVDKGGGTGKKSK